MGDITGATAIFMLGVADLYPAPQLLQGFGADAAFDTDATESSAPIMCLDGQLLGSVVLSPIRQQISLQADSPSNAIFDNWYAANQTARQSFVASATITIPSVGMSWSLGNGLLVSYMPISPVHRILQPRRHTIAWGSIASLPLF